MLGIFIQFGKVPLTVMKFGYESYSKAVYLKMERGGPHR